MYKTIRRTNAFNLNLAGDRAAYDEIHNNPLCTILEKIKEKLRQEQHEGETKTVTEQLVLIVTWQEKQLC